MASHSIEVQTGERFEFGKNWAKFLRVLNEDRIARAQQSVSEKLETGTLQGLTFLDIGSGSGLFSLAARRLGARVRSFDYDPNSVGCTRELRRRFFPDDPNWIVEEGSALDVAYLRSLGHFDIVYSWGVLHHTGNMWQALDNVAPLVSKDGLLFISLYNDQGKMSRRWKKVKKLYNSLPAGLRFLVVLPCFLVMWWRRLLKDLLLGHPLRSVREYGRLRGMSLWQDVIDWVGGYPFEVSTPEQIFDFYRARGFSLRRLHTDGASSGCNEFVFQKTTLAAAKVRPSEPFKAHQ